MLLDCLYLFAVAMDTAAELCGAALPDQLQQIYNKFSTGMYTCTQTSRMHACVCGCVRA